MSFTQTVQAQMQFLFISNALILLLVKVIKAVGQERHCVLCNERLSQLPQGLRQLFACVCIEQKPTDSLFFPLLLFSRALIYPTHLRVQASVA